MSGLLSILKPSSCPKIKNRGVFNLFFGANARDGSSAAKAIVVDSVAEEYAWLASNGWGCPGVPSKGYTFVMQDEHLKFIDDKPYDVITLHHASGGERNFYFDISKFYGIKFISPTEAEMNQMVKTAIAKRI